ncbi:MAG: helix-turn-helix transcriptional regulator [Pseudohongiellaceae bacterium]
MPAVGSLLSEYRKRNRLSQLDLAMLADVSSRHISFIETGRSSPSRNMLLRLAEVLNLPHKDSNLLLNSGGYAPAYSALDLGSEALQPVRQALKLMLDNHNPYPALVMDASYNLLMANTSQQRLFSQVVDNSGHLPTNNLLEAVLRHDVFKPLLLNWEEVASHLLRRLRRQVLAYDQPEHRELLKKLLTMDVPENWQAPTESPEDGPILTIDFKMGEQTLSMFTAVSRFGTALDIGVEEILIEHYFPADAECEAFFSAANN